MRTIIVGYDASDEAERALARAAELAEALSAQLVIVSVSRSRRVPVTVPVLEPAGPVPVPSGAGGPVATGGSAPLPLPEPERVPEPKELAQRLLEQARMTLARRGIDAEYVAEVGPAAERLLDVAAERDAELIVVGSRERGVFERLVARPVEERIARHAGGDVLLVR